ncbi:unnamed protein product [Lactuca saligna]|uniref:Auxin-responsive protein n=1 Tax=Lactuca saligna TaxID=75948 RepID=A0AA35UMC0_LACSI|nr:unnamed protein product [Lactuca saligna]CAI9259909.1 unnamed protein product [Lactuca saligna]CAI9260153.1 unnamed protein product [Lactuca saligna]CAI9260154.1 unnamed protein product [Lactuca saligna]CAI9260155.1 unnamed protein product [Lactuca saligna]
MPISSKTPPKIHHRTCHKTKSFHIAFFHQNKLSDRTLHVYMAIRMPGIIQAKKVLGRSLSNGSRHIIPKGYFAVYVGDQEKRRFVVPLSLLNQHSFQDLLHEAEEEFGYDHPMGGLTIPCREEVFIDVACRLCSL